MVTESAQLDTIDVWVESAADLLQEIAAIPLVRRKQMKHIQLHFSPYDESCTAASAIVRLADSFPDVQSVCVSCSAHVLLQIAIKIVLNPDKLAGDMCAVEHAMLKHKPLRHVRIIGHYTWPDHLPASFCSREHPDDWNALEAKWKEGVFVWDAQRHRQQLFLKLRTDEVNVWKSEMTT